MVLFKDFYLELNSISHFDFWVVHIYSSYLENDFLASS